jgi:hypothetical protein
VLETAGGWNVWAEIENGTVKRTITIRRFRRSLQIRVNVIA